MAISNSTTLNDLVGQIVSADAQSYAYAARVMRPLVRSYAVPPGAGSIVVPKFASVAVTALTEGVAPSSTTMSTDGVTMTPTERGVYVQISKRTLHADPFQDLAPYGDQLGRALAQDEDAQILGSVNFTTANVNNTGGVDNVAVDDFLAAIGVLEAANAPQPYFAVMHPVSWGKIRKEISDAGAYANVGKQTVEGFGPGMTNMAGYVGSPYGVPTFMSTQIGTLDTGATFANILFSRDALACAYIQDIGVDVDDNVVARAIDLMAWYSVDCKTLNGGYGVVIEDSVS
jgi:hypothetical protein